MQRGVYVANPDILGNMLGTVRHGSDVGYCAVRLRSWGSLLLIAAITGCAAAGSGDNSKMCTEIGSQSGIGITVTPALARQAGPEAHVTVRWNKHHIVRVAQLSPSSTMTEETCSGDDPDSSCSAKSVPTGGEHGFAAIPDLPTTPVEVSVTIAAVDGKPVVDDTRRITAQATYPNGPKCAAGDIQGQLVVDDAGNLREVRS